MKPTPLSEQKETIKNRHRLLNQREHTNTALGASTLNLPSCSLRRVRQYVLGYD